jgi:hypothetical protein
MKKKIATAAEMSHPTISIQGLDASNYPMERSAESLLDTRLIVGD